jgi:hypothetical protein
MNTGRNDYILVDDSGLLALVDCSAYRAFVSPDWTYGDIVRHFNVAAEERSLAVWDCGDGGGAYVVRVRPGISSESGHRSVYGAISVTNGALHLLSYDALTMAAQFEDEVLPPKHEAHLRVTLPNGNYRIRVVQLYEPGRLSKPDENEPDFAIEYERGDAAPWPGVAWAGEAT